MDLGSSVVINAIFSIASSSIITSYMITIGCALLCRLQGRTLAPSRYSLGKWGIWINIASLIYLAPLFLFSFFPPVPNPTLQTMNWGIVMYGGVVILSGFYYIIWARKTYTPPGETLEDFMTTNEYDVSLEHDVLEKPDHGSAVQKEMRHEVNDRLSDL
jgi:hypothetical protein